jgi:hypothetical protein
MPKSYGIIKNLFNDNTLDEWHNVFKKIPTTTETTYGDKCWGIDIKCLAYNWFSKVMMPPIQKQLGEDLKLIFSTFIDTTHPLPIHDDIKSLPDGAVGEHAFSVLIPYTVEYAKERFSDVGTCFYNNDKTMLERVNWNKGSLIWWKSSMLHSSSNFLNEGVSSKQYFVTHTYV